MSRNPHITKFFTTLCYATKIILKFHTLIRLKQHECLHCKCKKCIFPKPILASTIFART